MILEVVVALVMDVGVEEAEEAKMHEFITYKYFIIAINKLYEEIFTFFIATTCTFDMYLLCFTKISTKSTLSDRTALFTNFE